MFCPRCGSSRYSAQTGTTNSRNAKEVNWLMRHPERDALPKSSGTRSSHRPAFQTTSSALAGMPWVVRKHGVTVDILRRIAGHSSVTTTLKFYKEAAPEDELRVLEALEARRGGAGAKAAVLGA